MTTPWKLIEETSEKYYRKELYMYAIERALLHLKTLCGGIAGDNKEEGAKSWNIEDRTLDARD